MLNCRFPRSRAGFTISNSPGSYMGKVSLFQAAAGRAQSQQNRTLQKTGIGRF